jgi:hypothetical protein
MEVLVGTDFFTVEVLTLKELGYLLCPVFHSLGESRRVSLAGMTPYPGQEWMEQQARKNLILFPLKREGARDRKAAVRCRERLGGLLKYSEREAA